ncbi:hypothetical protein ABIA27_003050 [Sinorhizobium fredii]
MPCCIRMPSEAEGGDDALRPHARLGKPEMQRMVGPGGQHRIDGDQVLHARNLGGKDDAIARQAEFLGKLRREQRRLDDRLARHLLRRQR